MIHCAAERRPDAVERDPQAAHRLNVEAPAELARACASLDPPAYLVCLSTDYVFDGRHPPYAVDATPHPLNAYGRSKLAAERAVLEAAQPGRATTVRVPVLYGETLYDAESAVNVLLGAIVPHGTRVSMDAYGVRYPTLVDDVARALIQLCQRAEAAHEPRRDMPPTLHFSAREAMTKYDMCLVLSRLWNAVCGAPVSSTEHLDPQYEPDASATQRPQHCKLDISAIEALGVDVTCTAFDEWWRTYLERRGPPPAPEAPPNSAAAAAPAASAASDNDTQPRTTDAPDAAGPVEPPHAPATSTETFAPRAPAEEPAAHLAEASPPTAEEPTHPPGPHDNPSTPYDTRERDSDEEHYGTPHSPETTEALPADPYTLSVRVGDPQRVGDPVTAHVVYTVRVSTNAPWFARPELSALRRYSDFRWLHAALVHNHPGVVVPPLPEKVKIGRFAPDLVEFRRRALERALYKMLRHPQLREDEDLKLFLESANLPADIQVRNTVKGPVVTPEHKTYFGWRQSLQQHRFREPDEWFLQHTEYLAQVEVRFHDMVAAISALSARRKELAAAQERLYKSLVTLSGSSLSRSVSTCFAALSEMKKRAAEASMALADHEANVLGLVVYEYERLVGSVRKAFGARQDVWQAWQRADDELARTRAKHAKHLDGHADVHMQTLSEAEMASAALWTRFDEVSRLCKSEFDRFERETVVDLREAFVAYVRTYQRLEQDMLDEWSHCESIVRRARARSAESAERQAERMQHSGAASAMARSAPEKHSDSLPVDSKAESAPEPA